MTERKRATTQMNADLANAVAAVSIARSILEELRMKVEPSIRGEIDTAVISLSRAQDAHRDCLKTLMVLLAHVSAM